MTRSESDRLCPGCGTLRPSFSEVCPDCVPRSESIDPRGERESEHDGCEGCASLWVECERLESEVKRLREFAEWAEARGIAKDDSILVNQARKGAEERG
jgi:hypothetical protein